MNETTTNQKDIILKISQRELITIHLIVDLIFNVHCFLCNLSQEKNSKDEIDLLNFIVVVFSNGVDTYLY